MERLFALVGILSLLVAGAMFVIHKQAKDIERLEGQKGDNK